VDTNTDGFDGLRFLQFGQTAISGDTVYFTGGVSPDGYGVAPGLYSYTDGTIRLIAQEGAMLDGNRISSIGGLGEDQVFDDSLALSIVFGSDSEPGGIFLANVPEPASLSLLAVATPALLMRRRNFRTNSSRPHPFA
jgi:hypothetical protein